MDWGLYEKKLQKLSVKVDALEQKPLLEEHLDIVWRCFANLHRARLYGLGPMGIQTSEIVSWLDLYQISGEARHIIYELINRLDEAWLAYQTEKKKNDGK